jgi:AbrB family looped-hinge helix DNA binding protein
MKANVSARGQVVIPKPIRDRLGIRPGAVLDFSAEGGRLVATKVTPRSPVDAVYGILKSRRSSDEILADLRGEPDVP